MNLHDIRPPQQPYIPLLLDYLRFRYGSFLWEAMPDGIRVGYRTAPSNHLNEILIDDTNTYLEDARRWNANGRTHR